MALSFAQAHRYLTSLSYGPTPKSVAALRKLGLAKWLKQQLNPDFAKNEQLIDSSFRAHNLSLEQVVVDPVFAAKRGYVTTELTLATMVRQAYSSRQLFEMLVEHFNDYLHTPLSYDGRIFRVAFDRDVIRANALGYFPKMLVEATFHPAMLNYLNLDKNTAKHPNENFGRELLELFSVTPAAGYTEDDVQNAAKLLTGFDWNAKKGELRALPARHYFGSIRVLDFTHANAPTKNAAELIDRASQLVEYLALHPRTAKAFAHRLVRRFHSDQPNPQLVDAVAKVYADTKGHIPSMVTALVQHKLFASTPPTKVKRPVEFVTSTVRALELKPVKPLQGGNENKPNAYFAGSGASALTNLAKAQGQLPMNWPFPDGYPDAAAAWTNLSAQVQRWNAVSDLTLGRMPKTWAKPSLDPIMQAIPATALSSRKATATALVTSLNNRFLGGRLPVSKLDAISSQVVQSAEKLNDTTKANQVMCQTAIICVLATPEWMLR